MTPGATRAGIALFGPGRPIAGACTFSSRRPNALAGETNHASLTGTTGVQHAAFALPDEEAGLALIERLESHGVETTGVGGAGPVNNTLFFDNNGLLLEATWPKP